MPEYVIAIKRVKDYFGDPIVEGRDPWEYAQYGITTAFPIRHVSFGKRSTAIRFSSEYAAKTWWENNRKYFTSEFMDIDHYDLSTLAVMEHIDYYKVSENLSLTHN